VREMDQMCKWYLKSVVLFAHYPTVGTTVIAAPDKQDNNSIRDDFPAKMIPSHTPIQNLYKY
jgi:hypothetical protein